MENMEIMSIKGGWGFRRLMEKIILNFHFDYWNPSQRFLFKRNFQLCLRDSFPLWGGQSEQLTSPKLCGKYLISNQNWRGGEDVLSSSGNSCPTMYCGIRSLINDILRSGGGEARTRRKQNCDFTRWLSLSLNSWSSFHLGCCHLFYIHATAFVLSWPFS